MTQPEALRLAERISDIMCTSEADARAIAAAADELLRLHAENEALRADAERYRWLRAKENANRDEWNLFGPYSAPEEIDAAIDAARKEGK